MKATRARPSALSWLPVIGVMLIAVNLRPSLTAVGPLVGTIRHDTGMSATLAGLLTTLPLIGYGVLSPCAPWLARRLGTERLLCISMAVLLGGILLRWAPPLPALFIGTAVLGSAIAIGNVLVPAVIKRDFPRHTGSMTGVYSTVLGVTAAIAAGVSVPLAEQAGLGWRSALAIWAIPAAVAVVVSLPHLVEGPPIPASGGASLNAAPSVWRSRLAWQVTLFFGLQSLVFYATATWLPAILETKGLDRTAAGGLLALAQVVSLVPGMVFAVLAGRLRTQGVLAAISAGLVAAGICGLLLPGAGTVLIWILLLGLGNGAAFAVALSFLWLRTQSVQSAARLSGMAQSAGYLLAATGPVAVGSIHDLTGGWTVPLLLLLVMTGIELLAGLRAGRHAYVTAEPIVEHASSP